MLQSINARPEGQYGRFAIEPWEGNYDIEELFHAVSDTVFQSVALSHEQAAAVTLWIYLTYFVRAANEDQLLEHAPILLISSPERQCGKSTLRELVSELVNNPFDVMNASVASLFRLINAKQPTLLMDEADTFLVHNQELIGIFNNGYKRDGKVIRQGGKNYEDTLEFSTWGTKCITGILALPPTLESRCIKIKLKRKRQDQSVLRKSEILAKNPNHFLDLKRKIIRFVNDNESTIRQKRVTMPVSLDDRTQDNWRGIFQMASFISQEVLSEANTAAHALCKTTNDSTSEGIELLTDLKQGFSENYITGKFIASEDITKYLNSLDDRVWRTLSKEGISPYRLAQVLKPYELAPRQVKTNAKPVRGYYLSDLEELFLRYL